MLFEYQKKAVELFLNRNNKLYLAFDTGLGKTVVSLYIACKYYKNVLIVCPASVKMVWRSEMEKFNLFPHKFQLVSYEYLREHWDELKRLMFYELIIFDEAHKLKNPTAKITKLCMKVFPKAHKLMLSATPFEKLEDFYSQLRILSDDHPFHAIGSFTQYKTIFFKLDFFKRIVDFRDGIKDYFYEKFVYPYVWFLKREEVSELPDLIEQTIYMENLEKFPSKRIQVHDVKENAVAHFLHKYYASALVKEKYEFVKEFIENNPKTIVFSYFKEPIEIFKTHYKFDAYYITGEDKRDLANLPKGDKPIFATYCLKEGLNLQVYHNIIFLNMPLAYRDLYQSISRVYRYGQTKKVLVIYLLGEKIDRFVYCLLQNKKDVLEEIRRGARYE